MFKKKQEIKKNPLLEQLESRLTDVSYYMYKQVENIILKQRVINIYPTGADRDKVEDEIRTLQHHLIGLIGEYDDLFRQYNEAKKIYKDCKSRDLPDSHTRIEQYYKSVAKSIILY